MSPDTSSSLIARAVCLLPGEEARTEAELLLADALGKGRAWMYSHGDELVPEPVRRRFEEHLQRRLRGEPVAQILGRREFWSLDLAVTSDTLIPRADTEVLVELALQRVPGDSAWRVLDLGTGSGAIALALARERGKTSVTAIDRDVRALEVARRNAARLGLDRVRFLRGDWFSPVVDERFDLIVSNPPYIAEADPHLEQGDLRFEPRHALVSGRDGLDAIRQIVAAARRHLNPRSWLLLEHGFAQGKEVRELLLAQGFESVQTFSDLESRDRVSGGQAPA